MNRLSDYLDHLRQAAIDACSFAEGLDKSDFLADKRTQQAIILNLVIIGEAATKIMDGYVEFVESHPALPWRSMRNRIVHGYFEINLDIVWDTVQTALPLLLDQLSAIGNDAHDKTIE